MPGSSVVSSAPSTATTPWVIFPVGSEGQNHQEQGPVHHQKGLVGAEGALHNLEQQGQSSELLLNRIWVAEQSWWHLLHGQQNLGSALQTPLARSLALGAEWEQRGVENPLVPFAPKAARIPPCSQRAPQAGIWGDTALMSPTEHSTGRAGKGNTAWNRHGTEPHRLILLSKTHPGSSSPCRKAGSQKQGELGAAWIESQQQQRAQTGAVTRETNPI